MHRMALHVQNWLENDDKDTWQHNRKQVGEGWYYYNADDIEYKHNLWLHYICSEFQIVLNGK